MMVVNQESYEPYSALMPVYYGEKPKYLELSMDSVFGQSVPPAEFILVCDGPLTDELEEVIANEQAKHSNLKVIRLRANQGAAVAFETGMHACKYDLIQKFGSDDYCRPSRAKLQLEQYKKDPDLAVVGGYMQMFYEVPGDSESIREVPCSAEEIKRFARRRNPFNDGTVMHRKSACESVGGYSSELRRAQDYDMYVRILAAGYKTCNIPQILADGRENRDAIKRRRTFMHFKSMIAVYWRVHKIGFSSFLDFLVSCVSWLGVLLVPKKACEWAYETFLRKNVNELDDKSRK